MTPKTITVYHFTDGVRSLPDWISRAESMTHRLLTGHSFIHEEDRQRLDVTVRHVVGPSLIAMRGLYDEGLMPNGNYTHVVVGTHARVHTAIESFGEWMEWIAK